MKKNSRFFIILLITFICQLNYGDVLLWSVNENARVDGTDIQTFLVPYEVDDDNWNAIRVKISGGGLTEPQYLDMWYDNPYDPPSRWEDGSYGIELGETGANAVWGTWGTVWNQARIDDSWDSTAMIQAELIRCDWDSETVLAVSEARTLQYMIDHNKTYTEGSIAPADYTPYNFMEFNSSQVPEPSSGLLFLVGFGLIGLRRKTILTISSTQKCEKTKNKQKG